MTIYPNPKMKRTALSAIMWKRLRRDKWVEQGGRCISCRRPVKLHGDLYEAGHLHHVKTKGAGGDDAAENTVIMCFECHNQIHGPRWSKKPPDWNGLWGE